MTAIETIVTDAAALEPLRLEEARDQIRIYTTELDTQLHTAIEEVREYCEALTARTLRTIVTRQMAWCRWPTGRIFLSWPPLIEVTAVRYYDVGNTLRTVAAANYRVQIPRELQGELEFIPTWTAPSVYPRSDAVQIEYTAGYQTREAVPACVKRAMKILLSIEFDDVPPNREENARQRAKDCLTAVSWGPYR